MLLAALLAIANPLPPDPPPRAQPARLTERQLAEQRAGFIGKAVTAEARRRMLADQASAQFTRDAAVMIQQFDNWFVDVAPSLGLGGTR